MALRVGWRSQRTFYKKKSFQINVQGSYQKYRHFTKKRVCTEILRDVAALFSFTKSATVYDVVVYFCMPAGPHSEMGSSCFYSMPGINSIEPIEFFRILRVA